VAYSPAGVAFGMGAGLLQKVSSNTMNFATKLSYVETSDGESRNVMKDPKSNVNKRSLPGELAVKLVDAEGRSLPRPATIGSLFTGYPLVVPKSKLAAGSRHREVSEEINLLRVVYDGLNPKQPAPITAFTDDFDTIRKRIEDQWCHVNKEFDAVSPAMKKLQVEVSAGLD